MEETKTVETMEQTQVEVPEVVSGDVVASAEDSGSSTLVAMAVGAGLFALGVGAVKGVKHLIAKHKAKKIQKVEAEIDDDDFDDFDDSFDDVPADEQEQEVKAEPKKNKKN